MQPRIVSILGVGLLGGSIGLAVKERIKDCRVIGYGHRPATLKEALHCGAIDQAATDPARAVEGAELVILCTPVGVFAEILRKIAAGGWPSPGNGCGQHKSHRREAGGSNSSRSDAVCRQSPHGGK